MLTSSDEIRAAYLRQQRRQFLKGIVIATVLVLVAVAAFFIVQFYATHICTEWGPYYTTYVPIQSGKTTIILPEQTRDCIGKWVPNR